MDRLSVARGLAPLRRRLARWRDGDRMVRPGGVGLYRSLAVADVDLDHDTVAVLEALTPLQVAPEGVHAVAWMHGVPIGELTLPGEPSGLAEALPRLAREHLAQQVREHLLLDALRVAPPLRQGALRGARAGRDSSHPASKEGDGSLTTVAVCTRDRPDDLARCLTAVSRLDPGPADVLVIDNASASSTTTDVVARFPFARCVQEPRAGLDWARNRALLEASTPIVAFTDDDVLVHPGWVGSLELAFAEEPGAAAVTGLVLPAELSTPAQVAFEAEGGFGRGYRRQWFGVAVGEGEIAAEVTAGTGGIGTGANAAFLREPLLELGGFDTALDVGTVTGGGGDLEVFFRLLAAGHQVVYEPSAVVRHRHRTTEEALCRQRLGDGTGTYSIYFGAGRGYGTRQRREFAAFGLWWAKEGLTRTVVESVLGPGVYAPAHALATVRGAVVAVALDLYGRAQHQAALLDSRHPDLPSAPPPVRPAAPPARPRRGDPVVEVDVLRDDLDRPGGWPASGEPHRGVRLQVSNDGRTQAAIAVRTGGTPLSSARLRRELVDRLGPALGLPGAGLDGAPPAGLDAEQPAGGQLAACVLMATRDRPEQLQRSLDALLSHDAVSPLRIVVVDNSADPTATQAVASGVEGVTVVHEPRTGLSRARNAGLPHTSGDVIVLVDDDVVVQPGWLDALMRPFADTSVVAVTGNVLPSNLDVLEAQLFEDYGGLGKGPHSQQFDRDWLLSGRRAAATWHIGATANAAVRRGALTALGPWAEGLGAGRRSGVGEDTEFFYRILHAGGVIQYAADAVVLHEHRTDRAGLLRQLRDYSSGHVGYHLEVLLRYRDPRSLHRILWEYPDYYVRHSYNVIRHRDYYPSDMLLAEVRGLLRGVPDWLVSRYRA